VIVFVSTAVLQGKRPVEKSQ